MGGDATGTPDAVRAGLLAAAVVLAAVLAGAGVGVDAGSTEFTVTASAAQSTVKSGETVTATVTVENTGSTSISSLGLSPATGGVDGTIVDANSTAATGVTADHRVLFRTVDPGETVTATVTVVAGPDADGTLSVDATVAAGFDAGRVTETGSAAVDVQPNRPPTASPVVVNTTENTTVTAPLNASDPDGDSLNYTVTTGPLYGTVSIQDGTFTFTPDDGFTGRASFRYQASDGDGGSDSSYVDVYVDPANGAPTADAGANLTVNALSTVTLNATGSTDPDGDALTYEWTQTGGPSVSLAEADTATPTFEAPDVDATTRLTFAVTVSDGTGTATDSVTVTVGALLDPNWAVGTDARLQHAAVATGPQRAFVGGLGDTLRAVSRADGTTAWTVARDGSLSDSSPVYADGRVFVGSGGGVVYAVHASNGTVDWTYRTDSAVVSTPRVVGTDGSGTFPGGTVYVGANDGAVLALNASDGSVRWTTTADGPVYSRPAVDADGRVYVTDDSGNMTVLDATDGAELWRFVGSPPHGHTSPVVADGDLYLVGEKLYRIDPADAPGNVQVVWSKAFSGETAATPTVEGDAVYLGTSDGTVLAANATDGATRWTASAAGPVSSAPALVDGRLVVAGGSSVHLLDASTGSELAARSLDARIRTAPTVAGDVAYVGTRNGTVVALGNVSAA